MSCRRNIKIIKNHNLDVIVISPFNLPEYLTKQCDYFLITKDNPILDWSDNFKSNLYKTLSSTTLDEKIIRSFLCGRPMNFALKLNNTDGLTSIMNFTYFNIIFQNYLTSVFCSFCFETVCDHRDIH